MNTSLTLFALLAACNMVTACGGVAPDDIGSEQAALTGVEPDEIDCTATAGYDARGVTTATTQSPPAPTEPEQIDCDESQEAGASGGVWKTTDGTATGEEGTREVDSTGMDSATAAGTGGASGKLVTYGPVITIKPKG